MARGLLVSISSTLMDLPMFTITLRRLLRGDSRAFAAGTVATLAVVIAAFVVIAQLAYPALWAPLPNAQSQQLLELEEYHPQRGISAFSVSTPNFLDWQSALPQAQIAAIQGIDLTLNASAGSAAQRIAGMQASANVFSVLGLRLQGQSWQGPDDRGVVLREGLFRQRFGDAPLGDQTLSINGVRRAVIGIAPDAIGIAGPVDAWLLHPFDNADRDDRRLDVWARIAPDTTAQTFAAALAAAHQQLAQAHPAANAGWHAKATPALAAVVGESLQRRVMMLLLAAALLVLLATVNLANLLIARGLDRVRDLATRRALGASGARLLSESTSEATLLALIGALLGVIIAAALFGALQSVLPASPRWQDLHFHWPMAMLSLLVGVVPVVIGGALAATIALNAARRQAARQRAPRARWRSALVLTQLALATCLLSIALILATEWRRLLDLDLGFDTSAVIAARYAIDEVVDGPSHARGLRTSADLIDAARGVPGVVAAAVANEAPLGAFDTSMMLAAGSVAPVDDQGLQVSWRIISEGYFKTAGTALLSGRDFGSDETSDSAILSASLAKALWPDRSPLGREVTFENGSSRTIVGVVADVRNNEIDQPTPTVYLPTTWYLWPTMTLVVRAQGDAAPLRAALLAASQRARPDMALFDIATLEARVEQHLAPQRQQLLVMQLFGAISVLLACVGIFSVVTNSLAQRRGELALRMAVGATRPRLLREEIRGGVLRSLHGAVLGIGLLAFAFPWLQSQLALAVPSISLVLAAIVAIVALGSTATLVAARPIRLVAPMTVLRASPDVS